MGYRLCGGTFFTLLTNVKRPSDQRKRYHGDEIKLNEANMLDKLVCLLNEEHAKERKDNSSSITSKFKNCNVSHGFNIPLNDSGYSDAYDKKIKENYPTALIDMEEYSSIFLQLESPELMDQLVRSLLELISFDETISEDATFYALQDGSTIKKKELIVSSEILIPALLVGIWHYIVKNVHDNIIGTETIRDWQLKKQHKNQTAKLRDQIGNSIKQQISIKTKSAVPNNRDNAVNLSSPHQSVPYDKIMYSYIPTSAGGKTYVTANKFLDNQRDKYCSYLIKIRDRYDKVKTLIYGESPRELESFFVCNNIAIHDSLYHTPIYLNICTAQGMSHISQYTILVGTGGLGKTMMMKHFLITAIDNYHETRSLPIFVNLKDFMIDSDFVTNIYEQIASTCETSEEDFKKILRSEQTLLLLDGLDEMRSSYLDDFHKMLTIFIEEYPSAQIIISSRPFSKFIEYTKFTIAHLCPFSKEQSLELVHKLDFRSDSPEIKASFEQELEKNLYKTHKEFAENPLLLTIMLMTYEQFAEVPSKMHVFYERAYLTLAKEHDANKGAYNRILRTGLHTDEFRKYISRFSALSYYDEKFEFLRTDIERYMKNISFHDDVERKSITLDNLIYDLCYSLCLMYNDGMVYYFIHRSFQEYFCALYFSYQMDKDLKDISDIFENGKLSYHGYSRADDNTFGMLYDMIPEKIKRYVFLPTLEKLFKKCDENKGYWTFLSSMYDEIPYTVGPTNISAYCDSQSFLFRFIAKKVGFYHDMLDGVIIPNPSDDFLCAEYYLVEYVNENGEDELEIIDEVDIVKYGKDSIVETGRFYQISVDELIDHPKSCLELRAYLESDKCPYYTEYKAARRYYQELKFKYSQKGGNLFDNLTL